mgnify:CR=1 FL=1
MIPFVISHCNDITNVESSIEPSAHQPAVNFIQPGITSPEPIPWSVGGIVIIPFVISHCNDITNVESSIEPSAHQPAVNFIQSGITIVDAAAACASASAAACAAAIAATSAAAASAAAASAAAPVRARGSASAVPGLCGQHCGVGAGHGSGRVFCVDPNVVVCEVAGVDDTLGRSGSQIYVDRDVFVSKRLDRLVMIVFQSSSVRENR